MNDVLFFHSFQALLSSRVCFFGVFLAINVVNKSPDSCVFIFSFFQPFSQFIHGEREGKGERLRLLAFTKAHICIFLTFLSDDEIKKQQQQKKEV